MRRPGNASNQDPYIALLDYRNTPIDGVTPAQAPISQFYIADLYPADQLIIIISTTHVPKVKRNKTTTGKQRFYLL